MKRLVTTLFIFLTTFSYAQKRPREQINIPFTVTNNGHILVTANVNGIEGQFVFDTGAGMNLLTQEFANKVEDLEKTHHFSTGHRATGEEITSDLWNSKTLKIGDFEINNEIFAVYDFDFPLAGLISLTPFKNKQITIDYKNKMLSIETEASLEDRVANKDFEIPILISNDKDLTVEIATYVLVEDKLPLLVHVDSGAGSGVYRFNSRYMKELGIDATKLKSEFRKSYFKPEEGNTFYFTTVAEIADKSKNISVKDANVSFIDGLIHEGIMGIDWIGDIITIDIPNKRMIVQK